MTVSNPKFLWSGEHWILYLRQPGESINSVSVSLYKTIYSNAGTGTVCLLQSDPKYGIEPKLLTDNREVADFVRKYIFGNYGARRRQTSWGHYFWPLRPNLPSN